MKKVEPKKTSGVESALRVIPTLEEPARLRQLMRNAHDKGADEVYVAAFHRLLEVLPHPGDGAFAHDAWTSILALEEMETEDRGRSLRLTRTRRKAEKDGVRRTLEEMAADDRGANGFDLLVKRGLPELTFEATVLRHAGEFDAAAPEAARRRLEAEGVDVEAMLVGAGE